MKTNTYHVLTLGDVEVSGKEFENIVVLKVVEGEEFTQSFDAVTRYEIKPVEVKKCKD